MLKFMLIIGIMLLALSVLSLVYNVVLLQGGDTGGNTVIPMMGDSSSSLSPVLAGIALVGGIALFGANQRKFK